MNNLDPAGCFSGSISRQQFVLRRITLANFIGLLMGSCMPAPQLLALSLGHSNTSKPRKDFPEMGKRRTLMSRVYRRWWDPICLAQCPEWGKARRPFQVFLARG